MVHKFPDERPSLKEIKIFFNNYLKYNTYNPNDLG